VSLVGVARVYCQLCFVLSVALGLFGHRPRNNAFNASGWHLRAEHVRVGLYDRVYVDPRNVSGPQDGTIEHPWATVLQGVNSVTRRVCAP
jgi:hypothetical protein